MKRILTMVALALAALVLVGCGEMPTNDEWVAQYGKGDCNPGQAKKGACAPPPVTPPPPGIDSLTMYSTDPRYVDGVLTLTEGQQAELCVRAWRDGVAGPPDSDLAWSVSGDPVISIVPTTFGCVMVTALTSVLSLRIDL